MKEALSGIVTSHTFYVHLHGADRVECAAMHDDMSAALEAHRHFKARGHAVSVDMMPLTAPAPKVALK